MTKTEFETVQEVANMCGKCAKKETCHHPCLEANKILNANGFEYLGDKP